jgi:hypothetical protein
MGAATRLGFNGLLDALAAYRSHISHQGQFLNPNRWVAGVFIA